MRIDDIKKQIEKSFSGAVDNYNEWATVQKKSAWDLISSIEKREYKNVLDVGCGTGFGIEILEENLDCEKITGLDFAPDMAEYCRKKWSNYKFICEDAENFIPTEKYDLIISNFTLQWFENIPLFINNCVNYLNKKGVLAFSLPIEGSFEDLQNYAFTINNKKLPLHNFPKKDGIIDIIKYIDDVTLKYSVKKYTEIYQSPLESLQSIKKIGASYKNTSTLSIKEMKNLISSHNYKNHFPLTHVTYKMLFIMITKE